MLFSLRFSRLEHSHGMYLIDELDFTQDELNRLFWKTPNGEFRRTELDGGQQKDFTMKVWLKFIYDKFIAYSGSDVKIKAIQNALINLKNNPTKYSELDIVRNRVECTVQEAQMGIEIFNIAQKLFGHFTVRLMFANMIDFYISPIGDYKVKIVSRPKLDDLNFFLKYINLIPSHSYSGEQDRYHKISASSIEKNMRLFAYFFMNSHLYLSIEDMDVKSEINRLELFMGPLVSIDPSSKIGGKDLRELYSNIATFFSYAYDNYADKNLRFKEQGKDVVKNPMNFAKTFINEQNNILKVLVKKILGKVVLSKYLGNDISKNLWFAKTVINLVEKDLFTFRPSITTNIRLQIEGFAQSKDYARVIEFSEIPDPIAQSSGIDIPFSIVLTQDDLIGVDFNIYDQIDFLTVSEFRDLTTKLFSDKIDNTVRLLERAIWDMEGGKAKIFPMVNTHDPRLGLQFFKPNYIKSGDYNRYLPNPNPHIADSGIFSIDLLNAYDKSIRKLRYIVNLMLVSSQGTNYDYSFVVKSASGQFDDGMLDFAFDRYGMLRLDEIYSVQAAKSITDDYNVVVDINGRAWTIMAISTSNGFYEAYVTTSYFRNGMPVQKTTIEYINWLDTKWGNIWDQSLAWNYFSFNKILLNNKDLLNNQFIK